MTPYLPTAGAAYRGAARAYLAAEARRWDAQLRLHLAVAGGDPAAIHAGHLAVCLAARQLADATAALETAEAALRAAIPIPLPLEMFHD